MATLAKQLIENFDGASLNTGIWLSSGTYGSGGSYSQTGGRMVITMPNGVAGANGAYVGTEATNGVYDMTSSGFYVNVVTVPNAATHAFCYIKCFTYGHSTTDLYQFQYEAGTLYFQKIVSSSTTTIGTLSYDAALHKWWRIRESGGIVYWDYSCCPDSVGWVNVASDPISTAVTALCAEIGGGTYQSESSPGTAVFDNFNCYPKSSQNSPYCNFGSPILKKA